MNISIALISIILTTILFIPFFYFMYKGVKNKTNAKKQINAAIKDNGIVYSQKEFWRKNFIGISSDKKTVTYIHFYEDAPIINNISLEDLKQCNVIKSLEKENNIGLKNLELELVYKSSGKPHVSINFFNIDNDLSEDFELQRIETWQALIRTVITEPQQVKMAS